MDWSYAGDAATCGAPLAAPPTAARLKWFAWLMRWYESNYRTDAVGAP